MKSKWANEQTFPPFIQLCEVALKSNTVVKGRASAATTYCDVMQQRTVELFTPSISSYPRREKSRACTLSERDTRARNAALISARSWAAVVGAGGFAEEGSVGVPVLTLRVGGAADVAARGADWGVGAVETEGLEALEPLEAPEDDSLDEPEEPPEPISFVIGASST